MKERSKVVLEGAITELLQNEYDRYLSVEDMITNIDSQQYLGSVTADEAKQCVDILKRVKELKDNEITLLQTLARNMYAYVRPEKTEEIAENSEQIEEQVTVDEVTGTAAELNTDRAMKGIEEYNVDNVETAKE